MNNYINFHVLYNCQVQYCRIKSNHISKISVEPDQAVLTRVIAKELKTSLQGSHRLEKYLNIQDCLEN